MTSRDEQRPATSSESSAPLSLDDITQTLAATDPRLAALIGRVGPCGLQTVPTGPFQMRHAFALLVGSIASQQLSSKAADTIFGRVRALGSDGHFPAPAELLAISEDRLRQTGLSGAKARSVRDLAERVHTGALCLESLHALGDEAVTECLCQVKGIGRWTAEMFLMFRLGRLDILPLGDRGIQRGLELLFALRTPPAPERMIKLARPWRPYRSVACWYLWRLTEMGETARSEIRLVHKKST